jgi:hypothetical protein
LIAKNVAALFPGMKLTRLLIAKKIPEEILTLGL